MYRYPASGGGEKRTGRERVGLMCAYLLHGVGAALPIFAKKRPRLALMAFSSSQSRNSEPTSQQRTRQDKSSVAVTRGEDNKENITAAGLGYNHNGREMVKWR